MMELLLCGLLMRIFACGTAGLECLYEGVDPKELPERKPRVSYCPKFCFAANVPNVRGSSDLEKEVSSRLAGCGFRPESQFGNLLTFKRPAGMLSIGVAVSVRLGEGKTPLLVTVESSQGALLDIGGTLWNIANEIRQCLVRNDLLRDRAFSIEAMRSHERWASRNRSAAMR